MIKAGQLSKGNFIRFKNDPYLVSEREFVNPGKGSAFVRLKLKNVRTGLVIRETIKSQEQVEDIVVEDRTSQYLYKDAEGFHFRSPVASVLARAKPDVDALLFLPKLPDHLTADLAAERLPQIVGLYHEGTGALAVELDPDLRVSGL